MLPTLRTPLESMMLLGCGRSGGGGFVGPLDDYTTDLKVALLPFRGFASYVEAACRLRDDGDEDAEQSIEFDATTGNPVSPVLVGNGAMRWWYDQSGNAKHLPQATATAQPFWTPNIVNGYPVARFDGISDEMLLDVGDFSTATFYIVAKRMGATTNGRLLETGSLITASLFGAGDGTYQYYIRDGAPFIGYPGGTVGDWSIVVLKHISHTSIAGYVNGVLGDTWPVPNNSVNRTYIRLCSSSAGDFGQFDVAAVLRYDSAHDDTTREAIETILADKFSIALP
jgi:hypothetical protein